MEEPRPYRVTPVFDQDSLPAALRRDHSTRAGVWGIVRVLEGRLRFTDAAGALDLTPDRPGLIHPERKHKVEPIGQMRMQVEFYDERPAPLESGAYAPSESASGKWRASS
jgi:tellurite resistance-related uncharacterized protein